MLALDVGRRRIGLAVSDELGMTAQGLETFTRTNIREDMERLRALAAERSIAVFLLGLPLYMSGDESRQAAYVREFGDRLQRETALRVEYWDERLTTVQAERVLKESGVSLEKRKRAVDRLAAVILLESYLAARQQTIA